MNHSDITRGTNHKKFLKNIFNTKKGFFYLTEPDAVIVEKDEVFKGTHWFLEDDIKETLWKYIHGADFHLKAVEKQKEIYDTYLKCLE